MLSTGIHRRGTAVRAAAALLTVALFAACEGESSPTAPNGGGGATTLNTIVTSAPLNATSTDTLVYFSFASGTLVPSTSSWDIALRRYEVRLNGGAGGTKGVLAYSLDNDKSATDAQVLAYTVDNTLSAFDAVRAAQIPATATFKADFLAEDNTAYLNLAGVPSANAAAYWKMKTANGGYAVFHVTAIVLSAQFALTSVTIESRIQNGATLGAAQQVTIPVGSSALSVSLATNQVVTPTGCNWDLQLDPQSFALTVNAGCGAGTYPGGTVPAFAAVTTASDAPQYGAFISGLSGPIPNSVTDTSAPFRYNLTGNNRLSPTFNTYLVMSGANVYKMQVVNYYSDAGASGWPTIRYARIQ